MSVLVSGLGRMRNKAAGTQTPGADNSGDRPWAMAPPSHPREKDPYQIRLFDLSSGQLLRILSHSDMNPWLGGE